MGEFSKFGGWCVFAMAGHRQGSRSEAERKQRGGYINRKRQAQKAQTKIKTLRANQAAGPNGRARALPRIGAIQFERVVALIEI